MRKFIFTGLLLSFGILQSQNEKIKKINDTINNGVTNLINISDALKF